MILATIKLDADNFYLSICDRNCHSSVTKDYKNAGFQEYTVLSSSLAAPIPDKMAFSAAVVLPVAISTAASALFGPENLGISLSQMGLPDSSTLHVKDLPFSQGTSTILIWGGSTSVGSAAIQLACAAGLQVITTASKHNFGLCKDLGAHQVFDRETDSAVDEIVAALQGKVLVGALNAVGAQSTLQACIDIIVRTGSRKLIATTLPVEEVVDREGVQVNFCKRGSPFMAKSLNYLGAFLKRCNLLISASKLSQNQY